MRYTESIQTFDEAVNYMIKTSHKDFAKKFDSLPKEEQQEWVKDDCPWISVKEADQFSLPPQN